MLKFLCLLLIAVAFTNALPAGDKSKEDMHGPELNSPQHPAQAAGPYPGNLKPPKGPVNGDLHPGADNKDETLDKSETFGFGWAVPYYNGWGYGGWGGYGGYGWGRYYAGPYYYWR